MDRNSCSPKAWCRQRSRSDIRISSGRAWACAHRRIAGSLYAVDLARAPDGRWWVLADRTQGPSGPGYALENRQIVRRAFPHLAQVMDVRPAAARSSRRCATELLRDAGDEPLAVVLTPGPFNETYFEHAYMARQLGFPLVEGHDLTVRDDTRLSEDARGTETRAHHPAPPG